MMGTLWQKRKRTPPVSKDETPPYVSQCAYLYARVSVHEHVPVLDVPPEHIHLDEILEETVAVWPAQQTRKSNFS